MLQNKTRYFNGIQRMTGEHQTDAPESSSEEVLPGTYWLSLLGHSGVLKQTVATEFNE